MDGVITLTERHDRTIAAMRAALPVLDAALSAYARENGGRFIRFGSSATNALRLSSDIDLIADFPTHRASVQACSAADDLCFGLDLLPDARPIEWASDRLRERALAGGIVLP